MSASHKDVKSQGKKQNTEKDGNEDKKIAVNGLQQVLDMLRVADPAFRESLLRRLAARDQELARVLRRDLGL